MVSMIVLKVDNLRDVQLFSDPRFLGNSIKRLGFVLRETGDLGTVIVLKIILKIDNLAFNSTHLL